MKYLFLLSLVSLTNHLFAAESSAPNPEFGKEQALGKDDWACLGTVRYNFKGTDGLTYMGSDPCLMNGIAVKKNGVQASYTKPIFYGTIEPAFEQLFAQAHGTSLLEDLKQMKEALTEVLHPDIALQLFGNVYHQCSLKTLCANVCQERFEDCWLLKIPGESVRVFETQADAYKAEVSLMATVFMANQQKQDGSRLGDVCIPQLTGYVASKSPEVRHAFGDEVERKMKLTENHTVILSYLGRVVRWNSQHHSHS